MSTELTGKLGESFSGRLVGTKLHDSPRLEAILRKHHVASDNTGLHLACEELLKEKKYTSVIRLLRGALMLDSKANCARTHVMLARARSYNGNPQEAHQHAVQAMIRLGVYEPEKDLGVSDKQDTENDAVALAELATLLFEDGYVQEAHSTTVTVLFDRNNTHEIHSQAEIDSAKKGAQNLLKYLRPLIKELGQTGDLSAVRAKLVKMYKEQGRLDVALRIMNTHFRGSSEETHPSPDPEA